MKASELYYPMNATDHVSGWKVSAAEAAIVIADEWCRQKTESIDLWGCDWFGQEFIEKFLERCSQNRCLGEAIQIKWWFPCEGCSDDGPSFYERTNTWIANWTGKVDWQTYSF